MLGRARAGGCRAFSVGDFETAPRQTFPKRMGFLQGRGHAGWRFTSSSLISSSPSPPSSTALMIASSCSFVIILVSSFVSGFATTFTILRCQQCYCAAGDLYGRSRRDQGSSPEVRDGRRARVKLRWGRCAGQTQRSTMRQRQSTWVSDTECCALPGGPATSQ